MAEEFVEASIETIAGDGSVVASTQLARALVIGFDDCDSQGIGLTQNQRIALVQCALNAYDGTREELEAGARATTMLRAVLEAREAMDDGIRRPR
jgi:hypothetical protein